MDAKAGEYRRSELPGFDVTISARYHCKTIDRFSTTSSESQESYLTTGMLPHKHSSFFPPTHGSIMLLPRQPRVFARLARWQLSTSSVLTELLRIKGSLNLKTKTTIESCTAYTVLQGKQRTQAI